MEKCKFDGGCLANFHFAFHAYLIVLALQLQCAVFKSKIDVSKM